MISELKRFLTLKTLWIFANITGTAFLTIQLGHVLEGFFKPTITRTWEEKVPLRDMDFPLDPKICVIPGFNQAALYDVGYEDTWQYFRGQSRFNESVYGWAGHTKDSGIVGSVEEIIAHVIDYRIENVIEQVWVWTKEGDAIKIPLQKLTVARVNYPNNCLTLPLNKIPDIKGKQIQELLVFVNFTGYNSIEIHFVGDTLVNGRHIKEHRLNSGGDVIKLTGQSRSTNYMIDITQRILVEEDPTNTCIDYPNQEYSNYDE